MVKVCTCFLHDLITTHLAFFTSRLQVPATRKHQATGSNITEHQAVGSTWNSSTEHQVIVSSNRKISIQASATRSTSFQQQENQYTGLSHTEHRIEGPSHMVQQVTASTSTEHQVSITKAPCWWVKLAWSGRWAVMKLPRFRVRSVVALLVLLSLVVLLLNPPAHHSRLLLEKVPRSAVPSSDLIFLARLEGDEEGRAGGPVQQTANTRGAAKDSKADRTNVKEPFTKNFFALDKESKGKEVIATKMTSPKSPKEESVAKISPEEDELEEKAERPMSHKEAGYVNDIYVEDYTPQDFVEVKKLHPVTSKVKAPGKKPAVASQRRPSPQSMPHTLRERALTFSNTSALWKFLKEQERRAQHVKATCQERFFPMVDLREWMHVPPRALLGAKDIIYDSANHLAFCPVYKAASTSWSITLLELGGYWRESLKKKNSLQLLLKQIFPRISNFAASSITSDCTRFMVVRHPFERLVSCYRDKFQDASKGYYYLHYGEKMVRRYRKFHDGLSQQQISLLEEQVRSKVKRGLPVVLPENPFATPLGPTFSEFVQYILDAHHDDEHWRTYEAHCSPCILPYDFILRFESLPEEGKLFLEYLNRTGDVRPRWDNPTQGVKTGQVACSYFKQLPLPYVHMLYEKYKSDFDLYEYSPDDYFRCAKDAKPLSTVPGRTRREEKRSS